MINKNNASTQTLHLLEQIVKPLPIGTNLSILYLLWVMMQGHFLASRGSLHTALFLSGLPKLEIGRCWRAVRKGKWHIDELIEGFRQAVEKDGKWQRHKYGGYHPVSGDNVIIWRPRLKNWPAKFYRQLTGGTFTGIGFGLIVDVGEIWGQRLGIIRKIIRCTQAEDSEKLLKEAVMREAADILQEDEVFTHDAGVSVKMVQEAGVEHWILRFASNTTARRNELPKYKGRGKYPEYGTTIRPLRRKYKERWLEETPCDETYTFVFDGRKITARVWRDVVRSDQKVGEAKETYNIWSYDDPAYKGEFLLGTNVKDMSGEDVYLCYKDRWPVEQVPLVSKNLLGGNRQFVYKATSCWRLGELMFLAGNMLSWLAAISPTVESGYWDRRPKKRLDGIGGNWEGIYFQKSGYLTPEFEKSGQKPASLSPKMQLIW